MVSPDLPITKSQDDKLNRRSFANSLAQTLLKYSFTSSLTIGLYGEWGSGKTSLLNMILETVESADDTIVILRFNPWLCSDPRQLITQFFKQLSTAIKLKKPTAEQAWDLIDQFGDVFELAGLIPGAGVLISTVGKILDKKAKEHVEKQSEDLQDLKNQIVKRLKEERLRIIVSIDDIDRLSEEEIIAVFQLVKALADFPNTIYLLAFDYKVVIHALSKVQYGDGKEYLEKVIQVPFEIPAPSMTSIHEYLFSKLNKILGDIPDDRWDKETWVELFQYGLKEYIRSIRDVIRYTNVFSLKYELLKHETNPVDLLGLTCLQVFEPVIYSKLPNYKDTLCGTYESYSYERQKEEEENIKKTIAVLIPDSEMSLNAEAAKKILGILFPKVRPAIHKFYYMGRSYIYRSFLINNNIAVSLCFDRYFSLTLEEDAISTSIIKHLVYEANETEFIEELQKIYREGKITRMLEELQAYADKRYAAHISAERASLIIKCLVRQWDSFKVDDNRFLSIPFVWRLIFCVEPLLEVMELPDRFAFICEIFEDRNIQTTILALLLDEFETQQGRFTEENSNKEQGRQLLSIEQVLSLEQIFKVRAEEALDSRKALEQYNGLSFLWMLEKIDPELAANKKKSIIIDDVSLIRVITYCTSHGSRSGRITSKTWGVNLKVIEEFINIDDAYQRICIFAKSAQFLELMKEEQMDAVAFLISIEDNGKKSIMGNHIVEEVIQKRLDDLIHEEN